MNSELNQIIVFGGIIFGIFIFIFGLFINSIPLEFFVFVSTIILIFVGSFGRYIEITRTSQNYLILLAETLALVIFSIYFTYISFTGTNDPSNINDVVQFSFLFLIVLFYWLGIGIKNVLSVIDPNKIIEEEKFRSKLPSHSSSILDKANQGQGSLAQQMYMNEVAHKNREQTSETIR